MYPIRLEAEGLTVKITGRVRGVSEWPHIMGYLNGLLGF